ncbi:MAG: hypothetical protein V3573_11875 [Desulfovibrionaceae bacterium]
MFGTLLKKLATPPPFQIGKRNLERAHRALLNNDMAQAAEYNTLAAQAFRAMLTQAEGKPIFPARLVAAGVALLREGDPETAATLLERAVESDRMLLPAMVWAGLAHAMLGRQEQALRHWQAFPGVQAGQVVLDKILKEQVRLLEMTAGQKRDLAAACNAVSQALIQQERISHREGKPYWLLERL